MEQAISTTATRISDELKARLHALAKQEGTSAHTLILEAIAEKEDQMEHRNDFYAEAEQRAERISESGETVPWNDMKSWLNQRLAGSQAPALRLAPCLQTNRWPGSNSLPKLVTTLNEY